MGTAELYLGTLRLCRSAADASHLLRCVANDVLEPSGYEKYDVHEASSPVVLVQSRAGLGGRFDGRSGLRAVGLLDVAATVIVAGSPARERFSVDGFGDVCDEVLIFSRAKREHGEPQRQRYSSPAVRIAKTSILIAIARAGPQAVRRAYVDSYSHIAPCSRWHHMW